MFKCGIVNYYYKISCKSFLRLSFCFICWTNLSFSISFSSGPFKKSVKILSISCRGDSLPRRSSGEPRYNSYDKYGLINAPKWPLMDHSSTDSWSKMTTTVHIMKNHFFCFSTSNSIPISASNSLCSSSATLCWIKYYVPYRRFLNNFINTMVHHSIGGFQSFTGENWVY